MFLASLSYYTVSHAIVKEKFRRPLPRAQRESGYGLLRRGPSRDYSDTHLGALVSASAAMRSSRQRANSLTLRLGFFVSASFEILDDAPQLIFGDVLVFHRSQHGWN